MKIDIDAMITAKILKGGGDVTVESLSVTENGTYTAEAGKAYSPVTVNVSGDSGITKIAEKEFEVSTTSVTAITVGTIDCGETAWNGHKLLFVVVKDKAGKRNGHFYCNNSAFVNATALINGASTDTPKFFRCVAVGNDGSLKISAANSGANGVYGTSISKTGSLPIVAKYDSNKTLTIDGTYVVSVYLVDIDPFPGV